MIAIEHNGSLLLKIHLRFIHWAEEKNHFSSSFILNDYELVGKTLKFTKLDDALSSRWQNDKNDSVWANLTLYIGHQHHLTFTLQIQIPTVFNQPKWAFNRNEPSNCYRWPLKMIFVVIFQVAACSIALLRTAQCAPNLNQSILGNSAVILMPLNSFSLSHLTKRKPKNKIPRMNKWLWASFWFAWDFKPYHSASSYIQIQTVYSLINKTDFVVGPLLCARCKQIILTA